MALNQEKCHDKIIGRSTKNDKFEFDNLLLENRKEVVLSVTTDNKLTINRNLLLVKSDGFSIDTLDLMSRYLINRK